MELVDLQAMAEKERSARKPVRIRCCTAASCLWSGSMKVKEALEAAVRDSGFLDQVGVSEVGCMRLCCEGPLVQVDPDGPLYEGVQPGDAASIVAASNGGPEATARRGDPRAPFFT